MDFRSSFHPKNIGQVYGLETVNGYGASSLMRYNDLLLSDYTPESRILDLLNVRYIVSAEPLSMPRVAETPGAVVYENPDVLPRAWVAPRAVLAGQKEEVLQRLTDPGFDPLREVLVEPPAAAVLGFGPGEAAREYGGGPGAAAVFSRLGANRFRVRASAPGPGILVVAENWYPGWKASVSGRTLPVVRVDASLMAVPIQGPATVEFSYLPTGLVPGLVLGAAALGVLLAAAVPGRKRED